MKILLDKMKYIKKLNNIPLWIQLTILMAFVMTVPITIVSINMYTQNRNAIFDTEINSAQTVLNLESQRLDQYIKDLCNFSIQPCYDSTLTQLFTEKSPLSTSQESYLKDQIRAYYYSRSDVNSYKLYLMNQNTMFHRTPGFQRFELFSSEQFKEGEIYKACSKGQYFQAITPADSDDSLFVYSHSIIKIKNQESIAVASIEINHSIMDTLMKNHESRGEFLCLTNQEGYIFYQGNSALDENGVSDLQTKLSYMNAASLDHITLENEKYLVSSCPNEQSGLILYCLKPYSSIISQMTKAGRTSFFWGILLWIISLFLIILVTKFATRPLTTLAHKLKDVGRGDFTSTVSIGGSEEINHLSSNFNYMIAHIDQLIKTNYISQLNEKNARIIALEAQLNPHFLYNTLQAIATEALLNDQPQIYNMITSLAANLRYSIKAGDFVQLKEEYTYAQNYIALQQMRLGDRLLVTTEISPETENLMIPKISIQTLVENSIIHGITDTTKQLCIHISSVISEKNLIIMVTDNGCGFTKEHRENLQKQFESCDQAQHGQGIGLLNLYSRLQLLYSVPCSLLIDSEENIYTTITITIPLSEAKRNDMEITHN